MKLMSSSLLRCPCTEFNLHSPKSHAVIWHVYQTEATQRRPASAPPLAPALPGLVHLTVHLYSSSGLSSPHTDTHSLCLFLLLYLWFSPCTNDAYLAAAQAINPSSALSLFLSVSLALSFSVSAALHRTFCRFICLAMATASFIGN